MTAAGNNRLKTNVGGGGTHFCLHCHSGYVSKFDNPEFRDFITLPFCDEA